MRRWLLSALLLPGCSFDTSTNAGTGPGQMTDADPNAPDADPTAPDAPAGPFCGWGYDPVYFDPCEDAPGTLNPLTLNMANTPGDMPPYTYNTMTDLLRDPQMNPVPHDSDVVGENRVLWASSFAIGAEARLRVTGSLPLVIASKSTIEIDGALSVASFFIDAVFPRIGAGSEPLACMQAPAGRGENCEHGGGGGGGGGFSGSGGSGGNGAAGHSDCDDDLVAFMDGTFESTGGAGGGSVATPTTLRGGCAGREAGEGNIAATAGLGGPGGGAVHLTAAALLRVIGKIHAGGAGGRKSNGGRSGGGGGGSGGMIGLEASTIELSNEAVISANGGGGGGGAKDPLKGATDGQDAPLSGAQANGGSPEPGQGTFGGDGGWKDQASGSDGGWDALSGASALTTATRGGGGGGGGAGYILTYQDSSPTVGAEAAISPTAIPAP